MSSSEKISAVCHECGAPVSFPLGAAQVQCQYCGGGMAVGQGAGLIRLKCPRCTGNFYYIDGEMAGRCPYCEAPLLALTRDRLLRYVIPPRDGTRPAGFDGELLLLPFWRLAGLQLGFDFGARVEMVMDNAVSSHDFTDGPADFGSGASRRDSGPMRAFRGRVVDRNLADAATLAFGVTSLRLRAAVFAVEPFESRHEGLGRVVPPAMDVTAAREALYSAAMGLGHGADGMTQLDCQRAEIVADALSILYYPFWVASASGRLEILDAVTGEPERASQPAPRPTVSATSAFDELTVVEARCGACGAELPSGNRAVVFPCEACQTFWVAEREGLARFEARYAKAQVPSEGRALIWLPFWRVEAEVDYRGQRAAAAKDVRLVLGALGGRGEGASAPGDAPLGYFVPAYGALRAPKLDYPARDMTRVQPLLEPGEYAKGETFNCFFGPEDARQLGYVVLLQIIPGALGALVSSLRVRPRNVQLWYVPFADEGREVRNLLTGLRYDRDALRGVGH